MWFLEKNKLKKDCKWTRIARITRSSLVCVYSYKSKQNKFEQKIHFEY